ncbi:metallophosphoesterase family protein [Actinotalea sp. AC32]|nr:metallophosphoesterase family protein [Actinotalea sp. AC32]
MTMPPDAPGRRRGRRRRRELRGVAKDLLVVVALVLPAAVYGIATASGTASLGPHQARYEVTLDDRVTVDLGPLGTLVIESPVPALGARVTVQEIPRELVEVPTASTLEQLSGDLDRYVRLFSAPEATLDVAVRTLVTDALRRTAVATAVLAGLVLGVRALLGPDRRRELAVVVRDNRHVLVAAPLVLVVVASTVTASGTSPPTRPSPGRASSVFDGTALEGAVITGRLAGVIDTYGGRAVAAYRSNEAFYDTAAANVRAAWDERRDVDARVAEVRQAAGLAGPPQVEDPVVALVVSDLHCNVGMARVIRAAVEESGATVVLNAGDTTMNGTQVETYCITAFAQATPAGVTTVVADGNHDSAVVTGHARSLGWVVLDGQPVDVAGVRVLGARDPRSTRIGEGTVVDGAETPRELADRLADVACADDAGIDLMLVHDPAIGAEALTRGCAPAQVSGHWHRRIGPVVEGSGVRYVSSSTAGAIEGQATVGPLNGPAEMTVLRFDPGSGRLVDYRLVRVAPDADVTVSPALRWPAAAPVWSRTTDPDVPV